MICPHCKGIVDLKEMRLRSQPQSRYYFGVIIEILSNELGYTKNECHEILKELFLKTLKHLKTKNGVKEVWITKSTTNLTTIDFEEFLSQIRQWASIELSIYLPLPNEKN